MEKQRIAVVTGASGGLGKAFVKLLLQEGNVEEIWAVARNRDKLERLREEYDGRIKCFSTDLSDGQAFLDLERELGREKPQITYLINNAGYAKFCSYEDLDIQESLNMISLNCGGVVAMGLLCIPYMKQGGRILNIASQASFQPLPYQNLYSSTKAFVRNYSRALHVELREKGITVTAVCPGWMDTGLYQRANIGAAKATTSFWCMLPPEKVAEAAMRDAKKGKDMSVCGIYVKLCHLAAKFLPQRVIMWFWLKQQGIK